MMWARKAPAWDPFFRELTLALLGHALPFWPKGHTNLELITSLPDDTPGTKDSEVPVLSDPELSSRACTGLFSGSGPTVNRIAKIPAPSPVDGNG